jgi:hypothetical protein
MGYVITSRAGKVLGSFEGQTAAEALLALHRDAGYGPRQVWVEDGELHFDCEETRALCGGLEAYSVVPEQSAGAVEYTTWSQGNSHLYRGTSYLAAEQAKREHDSTSPVQRAVITARAEWMGWRYRALDTEALFHLLGDMETMTMREPTLAELEEAAGREVGGDVN